MRLMEELVVMANKPTYQELEHQLHQAQKMEAIGTLAGGVAHDFNNILMGIQARVSLMHLNTDQKHPNSEHLKAIERLIIRGADLTKQLLGCARGDTHKVEPTKSTFDIYLPATEENLPAVSSPLERVSTKGKETILLVDDEEMILEVGERLLDALGYKVILARSGREALDLYEKRTQEIDMVILDMIMPKMGGSETYNCLIRIDPNVKVLLSSGYSLDEQAGKILDLGCDGFVQKPFNMKALSEKVQEVLKRK